MAIEYSIQQVNRLNDLDYVNLMGMKAEAFILP
eukprot:CAMPEP_0116898424 /NCGR_PEP_ID=MMETSP0467-20121206/7143_1 /TAXON_ID=283647 /ORGANISM="Mesodinium pulex, Strain SPMC105" /LENGTH=32 /DNA_ID= /DNA_START= /DNA_END= /DNA_ORIENTATION=